MHLEGLKEADPYIFEYAKHDGVISLLEFCFIRKLEPNKRLRFILFKKIFDLCQDLITMFELLRWSFTTTELRETPPKWAFEDADSKNEVKFAKFKMPDEKWWTRFSKKLVISEKPWRNSCIGVSEDADFKNEVELAKFKMADKKRRTGFSKKLIVSEKT